MNLSFGFNKKKQQTLKISYMDSNSQTMMTRFLTNKLQHIPPERDIVLFCIGTDRSTGDCLGPLVGSKLQDSNLIPHHVFGTLDEPVHAVNLMENIIKVERQFENPFIIAIDACLGQISSVGFIQIADGPVKPGAGVHKELPAVGDMHITGIVNVGGFMEYFVLQNTRLSQVMNMAEQISKSIIAALRRTGRTFPPTMVSSLTNQDERFL